MDFMFLELGIIDKGEIFITILPDLRLKTDIRGTFNKVGLY